MCAGSPTSRPGCPEPHPAGPWMPPGMGHPQPPWATCSVRHKNKSVLKGKVLHDINSQWSNSSWSLLPDFVVKFYKLTLPSLVLTLECWYLKREVSAAQRGGVTPAGCSGAQWVLQWVILRPSAECVTASVKGGEGEFPHSSPSGLSDVTQWEISPIQYCLKDTEIIKIPIIKEPELLFFLFFFPNCKKALWLIKALPNAYIIIQASISKQNHWVDFLL